MPQIQVQVPVLGHEVFLLGGCREMERDTKWLRCNNWKTILQCEVRRAGKYHLKTQVKCSETSLIYCSNNGSEVFQNAVL